MPIFGKHYFRVKLDKEERREDDTLWLKCKSCGQLVFKRQVEQNRNICPKCGDYFFLTARERIKLLVDEGYFQDISRPLIAVDPLKFVDTKPYPQRLQEAQQETGLASEIIVGLARIETLPVVLAVMDLRFIGGSMGSVMGEQIVHGLRTAAAQRQPFILVSSTGGARMQEGILSLMQMAKVSSTRRLLQEAVVPFISVMTYPTTAGVLASIASLGDVTIAEKGALIGFTGPRVIKATINRELPSGFQTDQFALQHGLVDQVVSREQMRGEIARVLRFFATDPEGTGQSQKEKGPYGRNGR